MGVETYATKADKADLESAKVVGNVDLSGYLTDDALTRSLGWVGSG